MYARLVEATFFEHLPFAVAWELITCLGRWWEGSMWAMQVRKQSWWMQMQVSADFRFDFLRM
jgi:hypothetical protein